MFWHILCIVAGVCNFVAYVIGTHANPDLAIPLGVGCIMIGTIGILIDRKG